MKRALVELSEKVPVPFPTLAEKVQQATGKRPSRSGWYAILKGPTVPTSKAAKDFAEALTAIATDRKLTTFSFEERWNEHLKHVALPPEFIPPVVAQASTCGTFVLRYATTRMSVSVAAMDETPPKGAKPTLCDVYASPRSAMLDVLRRKRDASMPNAPAFAFLYLSRAKELAKDHPILVLDGFCLDHQAPTFGLVYASREGGVQPLVESLSEIEARVRRSRILCAPMTEAEAVLISLLEFLDVPFDSRVVPISSSAAALDLLQRGMLQQDTLIAVGHTVVQSLLHREIESRQYAEHVKRRGGNHLQVLTTDLQFGDSAMASVGKAQWPDSRYVLAVRDDSLDPSLLQSSGRYFRRVAAKVRGEYSNDPQFFETIHHWMVDRYDQPGCYLSLPVLTDLIRARMHLHVPGAAKWVATEDWRPSQPAVN